MLHVQSHALADRTAFSFLARACNWQYYPDEGGSWRFDWALGLNTLTSTNAFSNLPSQNPMTSQASALVMVPSNVTLKVAVGGVL